MIVGWGAWMVAALALGQGELAADEFPRFVAHEIDRVGDQLAQTALVDVDNDGDLDWIAGCATRRERGRIWWWEYRGPADWVRRPLGLGETDVGGAAHDVDGDGWVDFLSGARLLINPGNPREAMFEPHQVGTMYSHDTEFADIDGDGKLDVVANWDKEGLAWYVVPEDPTTEPWEKILIASAEEHEVHGGPSPNGVGDIDGDGDADVVTAGGWYENVDGAGREWNPRLNIDLGEEHRYGVAVRTWVGDVDGDGDVDVVQSEADNPDSRLAWFENDGTGEWTRHIIIDMGAALDLHSLAVADFDNDGDLDVYVGAGPMTKKPRHVCMMWVNNAGPGVAPTRDDWSGRVLLRHPCHEVEAGDVDGDGDIDLCTKPWTTGNRHVYLQNMLMEDRAAGGEAGDGTGASPE